LDTRKVEAVHKKLQNARRDGKEVILLSASIEPVIEVIADMLKVDGYYCTELEKRNGKYTGKVIQDIEGRKLQRIQPNYVLEGVELLFYTDNKEDLPLLKKVK